jgi:hypothetical protein
MNPGEKTMKKHLVLVGGGHAHMVTLANIRRFVEKGYRVTVIGPSAYHYYSGMGPGMLMPGLTFPCRSLPEKTGPKTCIRSNPLNSSWMPLPP